MAKLKKLLEYTFVQTLFAFWLPVTLVFYSQKHSLKGKNQCTADLLFCLDSAAFFMFN